MPPSTIAPSSPRRVVQPSSPGHLKPGISLSVCQSHGGSSRGHVDWVEGRPGAQPAGPPHVGTRDELVRQNRALFKQLESAQVEAQNATAEAAALQASAAATAGRADAERLALETQVAALHEELEASRASAASQASGLQAALDACRAELRACTDRLARTHASLGLTSERARVLETSKGRLQIDLDGTLSTLEEATRRHAEQQAEAEQARVEREAELVHQLQQAEQQTMAAERKGEVMRKRAARLEEALAQARQAHADQALKLTHEIERFADRLAAAEAAQLDPTKIINIAFARQLQAGKGRAGGVQSTASVPTTLLRGRLQKMVPPTTMASPAPV